MQVTTTRVEHQMGAMDTDVVQEFLREERVVHPVVERRITVERTCTRRQAPWHCKQPSPGAPVPPSLHTTTLPARLVSSGASPRELTGLIIAAMFML